MPGTEAKEIGILKDSELKSLVDFVKQNPEIEFVSLPRVRSADDVISIKQALLFKQTDPKRKIKILVTLSYGCRNYN